MQKYRLKNGTTIIFEKNSSKSVALEVMFKVGSNDENEKVSGISHFLEHMLFEGTKKGKTTRQLPTRLKSMVVNLMPILLQIEQHILSRLSTKNLT